MAIKKAKKICQDMEKKEKEILVGICFNKKIFQMQIIDLEIYI